MPRHKMTGGAVRYYCLGSPIMGLASELASERRMQMNDSDSRCTNSRSKARKLRCVSLTRTVS